jgi:T cell receptor alpha chain V region
MFTFHREVFPTFIDITLIFPGDIVAQSVTQPDVHVTVSEGTSLELRCKYSYSARPYVFSYIHYSDQGLQLLLKCFSGDTTVQGIKGFEAEFRKSESSFHLSKPSVHWSDTALYFCALGASVYGAAGGAENKPVTEAFPETQGHPLWSLKDLLLADGK